MSRESPEFVHTGPTQHDGYCGQLETLSVCALVMLVGKRSQQPKTRLRISPRPEGISPAPTISARSFRSTCRPRVGRNCEPQRHGPTVRRALGVPAVTNGTRRLLIEKAAESLTPDARRKAVEATCTPEARAKRSAALTGRARHPNSVAGLLEAAKRPKFEKWKRDLGRRTKALWEHPEEHGLPPSGGKTEAACRSTSASRGSNRPGGLALRRPREDIRGVFSFHGSPRERNGRIANTPYGRPGGAGGPGGGSGGGGGGPGGGGGAG